MWLALLVASTSTAVAQDDAPEDGEEAAEPARYGDAELIAILDDYALLDEWIAASPVSTEASLLSVTGGNYLGLRETFLQSLDTWATQTERLRSTLDRIDATQAGVDEVRTAIVSVRDALVLDDRLRGPASETLVVITDELKTIAGAQAAEVVHEPSDDPLDQAEALLTSIRVRADAELQLLNDAAAAVNQTGVSSFFGFDQLESDLEEVDRLLNRRRDSLRPEVERSEQLATSALAQIPELHWARMLGSTDVDGLSVVTVDAYVRAAASVSCSVDWALLAGIGRIESNHGRLGGGSVSSSGQVSPEILGPLLDGGATDSPDPDARVEAVVRWWWSAIRARIGSPLVRGLRDLNAAVDGGSPGNGFAVIVDSDDGRLDGNDEWDRAVGPMQFLPETWSRWATDGNDDGVADPHNLYDATASAARFLCHLQRTRGSSPSTYLRGYNDSWSYARSVIATADRLRSASLPGR